MLYNLTGESVEIKRTVTTNGRAMVRYFNEGDTDIELVIIGTTGIIAPGKFIDVAITDSSIYVRSMGTSGKMRCYRVTGESIDESDASGEIDKGGGGTSVDAYTKEEANARFAAIAAPLGNFNLSANKKLGTLITGDSQQPNPDIRMVISNGDIVSFAENGTATKEFTLNPAFTNNYYPLIIQVNGYSYNGSDIQPFQITNVVPAKNKITVTFKDPSEKPAYDYCNLIMIVVQSQSY